eukprot:GHVL01039881.1.p1 GENE.GHVL01039881.1~~GHVL01039881.1.p1  ORF type:complete len:121 (+),score=23.55 GHVL01039881.1:163-525(+)
MQGLIESAWQWALPEHCSSNEEVRDMLNCVKEIIRNVVNTKNDKAQYMFTFARSTEYMGNINKTSSNKTPDICPDICPDTNSDMCANKIISEIIHWIPEILKNEIDVIYDESFENDNIEG